MAKRIRYNTTKTDFARFKKYCLKYILRSRYTNWEIDFAHQELNHDRVAEV